MWDDAVVYICPCSTDIVDVTIIGVVVVVVVVVIVVVVVVAVCAAVRVCICGCVAQAVQARDHAAQSSKLHARLEQARVMVERLEREAKVKNTKAILLPRSKNASTRGCWRFRRCACVACVSLPVAVLSRLTVDVAGVPACACVFACVYVCVHVCTCVCVRLCLSVCECVLYVIV